MAEWTGVGGSHWRGEVVSSQSSWRFLLASLSLLDLFERLSVSIERAHRSLVTFTKIATVSSYWRCWCCSSVTTSCDLEAFEADGEWIGQWAKALSEKRIEGKSDSWSKNGQSQPRIRKRERAWKKNGPEDLHLLRQKRKCWLSWTCFFN